MENPIPKIISVSLSMLRRLLPGHEILDRCIMFSAMSVVLISFLFMISGCTYYKVSTRLNSKPEIFYSDIVNEVYPEKKYPREVYPEPDLTKKFFQERLIYIIDPAGTWLINNPALSGDTIFGKAEYQPVYNGDKDDMPETRENKRYSREKESNILKRINFYVNKMNLKDTGMAFIPLSTIYKCEIFKNDSGRNAKAGVGTFFLVIGGVFTLIILIGIIALIANPPESSSCPFVFAYDGNAYQFIGEIYGGAIYPCLERYDYLELPNYEHGQGSRYEVKVANMLREIQYINQAELLIVTHESNVHPLVDKYGNVQTIASPVLPNKAMDSKGNNCLDLIDNKDNLCHNFSEALDTSFSSNYLNSLELTFSTNTNPEHLKIHLNGKNSLWGDYVVREFYNLFGSRYQKFVKKQGDMPAELHHDWMLQQGLYLKVNAWIDGEWKFADYFNMVGALGNRDMVLPLDLKNAWIPESVNGTMEYTLKIRLEAGYNFWELDYAALDLSENEPVGEIWLPADKATDHNGNNVSKRLASDDDLYLVQKETGDEIYMDFTLPESLATSFTVFLRSKGYYEQAEKLKGEPEITLLKTFRNPGKLSLWSYMKFKELETTYQTGLQSNYPEN